VDSRTRVRQCLRLEVSYHSASSSAAPGGPSSSASSAASRASRSASRSSISCSASRGSSAPHRTSPSGSELAGIAGGAFGLETAGFRAGFAAGLPAGALEAFGAGTGFFVFFFGAADFRAVFRTFRAAGFLAARERALFFAGLFAAAFRAPARAPRRAAFFAVFFFFFATVILLSAGRAGGPDHTIASVSNRGSERIVIDAGSMGLRIEIRPLARTGGGRARLAALAAVVLGAALYGTAHLSQAWESGLRKGDYDLPLGILVTLTLCVAVATPLALLGLSALAFAEETIAVGPEEVTIETATFEKTRVRHIPLHELRCWRETYLPLAPWWTWAVKRLAATVPGRLEPVAGAASPKEKRSIGIALSRATKKPLVDDWGRAVPGSDKLFLCL
jgi:hypothetical protein